MRLGRLADCFNLQNLAYNQALLFFIIILNLTKYGFKIKNQYLPMVLCSRSSALDKFRNFKMLILLIKLYLHCLNLDAWAH
jgi:hypothetical protein